MYWIHAFTLGQSYPISKVIRCIPLLQRSEKVIRSISDSSGIVRMEGLSDIGSKLLCD